MPDLRSAALLSTLALAACGTTAPPAARDTGVEDARDAAQPDDVAADASPDVAAPQDVTADRPADAGDAAPFDAPADVAADVAADARDAPSIDAPVDVTPDAAMDVRDAVVVPSDVASDARDAGADAGAAVGCLPYVAPPRVDPCPGALDCGFSAHGRVSVAGARAALREFQVRVVLPPAVLADAGAACDHLVFRATSGAWAPHWVQDCAAGVVWVRAPAIDPSGTTLAMHHGGGAAVPAASSYDDVFDRVPLSAANLLGAWTFDEGAGTHTCPAAGAVPFDAFLGATPYAMGGATVVTPPALWSTDVPASTLGSARFARNNRSLNLPRSQVIDDPERPAVTHPGRLVNWQTPDSAPLRAASAALTVGLWVYTETPGDAFDDNWQTVISYGMPAEPAPPYPGADLSMLGNFNPWAIFFYGNRPDETILMTNTCAYPCLAVDQYAHIATRAVLPSASLVRAWHFVAMTLDTTTTPHAVRRAYYDGNVFEYQRDLLTWPPDTYCTGDACRYPPEGRIQYYDAPVLLGADMNGGEPGLGLEGRLDDLFILARAASPTEIQAYRERRQYSPDALTVTVTP